MTGGLRNLPLLFALSALLTGPAAIAEVPCDEFRLDGPGGPMEHVNVRDQDENGICYAVSIAEFYDMLRFSSGDRNFAHQTSGLYVANTYREGGSRDKDKNVDIQKIDGITGGYAFDFQNILLRLARSGSCSENQIRGKVGLSQTMETGATSPMSPTVAAMFGSAFVARSIGVGPTPSQDLMTKREAELNSIYARFKNTVKRIKNFIGAKSAIAEYDRSQQKAPRLDNYDQLYRDRRNAIFYGIANANYYDDDPLEPSGTEMKIFSNMLHAEFRENGKKGGPGQFPQTVHYLDSLSRVHADVLLKNYGAFLKASTLLTCPEGERVKSPEALALLGHLVEFTVQDVDPKNPKTYIPKIAAGFRANLKRYPSLVASTCFPFQRLGRGRLTEAFYGKALTKEECGGGHAFLVIGRRKNPATGRCEYLVRNSWGREAYYHSDWYQEPDAGIVGVDDFLLEGLSENVLTIDARTRRPAGGAVKTKQNKRKSKH